ncbi:MAG: MutS-related protein [Acidimicrobiales bacterium]
MAGSVGRPLRTGVVATVETPAAPPALPTRFSILLPGTQTAPPPEPEDDPAYFADLNLDQIFEAATARFEGYDLKAFFRPLLAGAEKVRYRQDVFRDLEDDGALRAVTAFASKLQAMRLHLEQAGDLRHKHQVGRWFLAAAAVYCEAVAELESDLRGLPLDSSGLAAFRQYLGTYVASSEFKTLVHDTAEVTAALGQVAYCVHIKENRVTVTKYQGESDYSTEVLGTFQKFEQGIVKDYRVALASRPEMNHVETGILDRVALLFPEPFAALDAFCERHSELTDETVRRFDREVHFYLAYIACTKPLRSAGLSFCYPEVAEESTVVAAKESFDLALALKLVPARQSLVCNDVELSGPERLLVVSGPNQGGKTTFSRMFGQLHHLAAIGCPVPGTEARLGLCTSVFTHFAREENIEHLTGKLEDDLVRIRDIVETAGPGSVVIVNEIFTSTTLQDALLLGTRVIESLLRADVTGVYVTFIDELARLGPATVSMVSMVSPENPVDRTFKVVRRPPDGLAYAVAIATKYGLDYKSLQARISP